MPRVVMVGLFLAIVTPLFVIVWWEFTRARGAPRSVSKAFKRHLNSQAVVTPAYVPKESKRGFDKY